MSVDARVVRARISEARQAMLEARRLASKRFDALSVDEVYSLRYNLIVLVEALAALAVHVLVEGYGVYPQSYRDALVKLAKAIGLNLECIEDLGRLASLRNLLIHRYWEIDDSLVHENVRRDFRCVEELLSRVEAVYLGGV